MADLNSIADTLSGLTVMEAANLAKLLEEIGVCVAQFWNTFWTDRYSSLWNVFWNHLSKYFQ